MARVTGHELLAGWKLGPFIHRVPFFFLGVFLMVAAPLSAESKRNLVPASGNPNPQFLEALEYPTGAGPKAAASGDLNHDGWLDLAVANSTDNTVSVLLGKGDGTFHNHVDYATGKGPSSVAIADFNDDGKLDLVVTNSTDNTVSVLMGNGDGTFQPHMDRPANDLPQSVVVADFNHDQKLDLALVNAPADFGQGNISVLMGNGDGTFRNPVQYAAAVGTNSLTVADLNADGVPDLAVANSDTANVTTGAINIFIGKGDGTFQPSTTLEFGRGASAIAVADLNGDGRVDLAVSTFDRNTIPGPDSLSIFLGNGDGTFGQPNSFITGSAGSIIAEDFDGDGKVDVAITSSGSNVVSILLGTGDGTFRSQVDFGPGNGPASLVAGDFNGDGHIDLVTADFYGDSAALLLGNGDGTFQARIDYGVTEQPVSLAVGDFNGDGKPDLATADQYGGGVSVLLGNGDGSFHKFTHYDSGFQPVSVVAADFNGDGKTDLATANIDGDSVSIFFGNGDGTLQPHVDYGVVQSPSALAVGDFNGDGKPDLVVVGNGGPGSVQLLTNNGDGTFLPVFNLGLSGSAVVAADFSGDSIDDLAIDTNSVVNILVAFQFLASYGTGVTALAAGDFNGDGKSDLVFVNGGNNQTISVLMGNGNGTFQPPVDYPTAVFPGRVAVGDFDGDGKPDIAVTGANILVTAPSGISVFTNNGDGTFAPRVEYATGVAPAAVAVGDFDSDGKLDLVTSNLLTSPLSYVGQFLPGSVSVLLNGAGAILTIQSSENPSAPGAPVTLTANVNARVPEALSPTGSVTLADGNTTVGTATLIGSSAAFSLPALTRGTHTISARYSGDQIFRPSTSVLYQAVVPPDFSLESSAVTPSSLSVGQSATATVTITSLAGFSGQVSLSCTVAPSDAGAPACSLTPTSVLSSAGTPATSTLKITASSLHSRLETIEFPKRGHPVAVFFLPFAGVLIASFVVAGGRGKKYVSLSVLFALTLTGMLVTQLACGGSQGSSGGGAGRSYMITIQGKSGNTQHSVSVPVIVD
jgi:Bacterial Ig-like domain (group 3)/FG-GAP-like repeat